MKRLPAGRPMSVSSGWRTAEYVDAPRSGRGTHRFARRHGSGRRARTLESESAGSRRRHGPADASADAAIDSVARRATRLPAASDIKESSRNRRMPECFSHGASRFEPTLPGPTAFEPARSRAVRLSCWTERVPSRHAR